MARIDSRPWPISVQAVAAVCPVCGVCRVSPENPCLSLVGS